MLQVNIPKLPEVDAHGACARYWRLGANLGLKAYSDQGELDEAWMLQRSLARVGAAPEVVARFELPGQLGGRSERPLYGYITEHAQLLGFGVQETWGMQVRSESHQHLTKVVRRVFGSQWHDAHDANWGSMVATGDSPVPVIIDYSYHSFGTQAKQVAKGMVANISGAVNAESIANLISGGIIMAHQAKAPGKKLPLQQLMVALPEVAKRIVMPVPQPQIVGAWACPAEWREQGRGNR